MLNIELKNSFFSYEGMEEKILALVKERALDENIIYSSFSPKSMAWIKQLNPRAHTALLGGAVSDLYWKYRNVSGAEALHPHINGMDVDPKLLRESGMSVRAWMTAPLYTDKKNGAVEKILSESDIADYKKMGITDIFMNNPEKYLRS